MGCISFLSAFVLVCLCRIQGSSAVTPVFVQTGKDLLLNVTKAETLEEDVVVLWKFNKNGLVRFSGKEPRVSPDYTGRIEFPAKKYSVKLKNLSKADSGVYTAQVIVVGIQTLDEYNVTVQDPVSPVNLTVVSRSSDSCNVTVTCSTQDSHINSTFRCDTQTCSQEGGEQSEVTTSGASLHVYVANDFIICNHSNQVSWSEDRKMAELHCSQNTAPLQLDNNIIVPVVVSIVVIFILIVLLTALLYLRKRKNSKTENIENTVYETPQQTAAVQSVHLTPTNDDSVTSPTSTYALVGPHTGGKTLPESLYASVEKPARS